MLFFACVLRRLEFFDEIRAYSAATFSKVRYRKRPPLALSLSQDRALFADITSTRRCGNPVLERCSCASPREGNSHDRKTVAQSQTTSPSVTLLPNLRQVQIPLSGTVPEVYIAYAIPRGTTLAEIRGLPNFIVGR